MEKITLNPETFDNVSKMLNSPDQENATTALMAMEQMDFNNSKLYMVLLYKETVDKKHLWEQNCPGVLKNINNLGLDEHLSFKSIFLNLKDKVSDEEMQVFLSRFGSVLKKLLNDWGFKGMVEDLDILITLKK